MNGIGSDRPESDEERSGTRPVYSIGAVVKMLGIDATTLRAWEERYQIIVPARSNGGQRIYSRDNLDHLRFIARAMENGSTTADAHRLLSEELSASMSTTRPQQGATSVVILLAERDRYAAELVEYLLRTEGYDVCLTFDPANVGQLYAERRPQLSVVELMLAGGGVELCRSLAQDGSPVLAISTLDLADDALEAGASAFLLKPIVPLQFVSTVRDLLGESALTQPSRSGAS